MIEYYDIPVIQAGDYNTVLQRTKDRAGGKEDHQRQKQDALTAMM